MIGRFLELAIHIFATGVSWCVYWSWRIFSYLRAHPKTRQVMAALLLLLLVLAVLYSLLLAPPADFAQGSLLRVKKGSTLESVASLLKERDLINSAILFEVIARLYRSDGVVVAGEYSFENPQGITTIARRLTVGDFELEPVRMRVVEGMSVEEITALLKKTLPDFDSEDFHAIASAQEGMLFPDTYFFLPGEDPELVLSTMVDNFNEHIRRVPVAAAITSFGKPLNEVLTMASLLEKEAANVQDRRIIAGILWNRIDKGMKLQVDAVFPYINGKNTFTLTKKDLQVDSPYNTYVYKGLPPGPIGSPSLEAIMAAVTPVTTSYVYYLSDMEGVTHYSTTYEQHLAKKKKYLDN